MRNAYKPIRCYLLALILIAATTYSHAGTDKNAQVTFSIPAQRLANALITLSKQARMPIIFHSEITNQKLAPALQKTATVEQALDELLLDTGLYFSIVEQSFIVIAVHPPTQKEEETTIDQIYPPGLELIHIYGHMLTGSRLARSDFEGSTPVDVLRQSELELRGTATIGEKLKFLPAVSGNPTSTAVTNGGDGTATITLRGLPASNTLVLINGRRVAADGLEGDAIDLNTIAPAAIDRVEILKDGASAIYGADAIAGVVNIVMKDHFDGLSMETFYGETSRGDMETSNTNLLWGKNVEKGSIFTSFTYFKQNGILSRDRSRSANADGRAWGGTDARSSATPAARVTLPSGDTVTLAQAPNGAYLDSSNPNNFRAATNDDLYNFSQQTSAFVPHEHKSFYSSLQLDIINNMGLFLETSYDKTNAETRFAPTPFSSAFNTQPVTISADNIYNPFGVDILDVRRRVIEAPARIQFNDVTSKRITAGINGINRQWSWEIFYSWNYSNAKERIRGLLDLDKLQRALGPQVECIGDCVALNVFGAPGSITSDQIAFVTTNTNTKGFSKLTTWSASAVGPLITMNARTIDVAVGLEYREESTAKTPKLTPGQGPTIGGSNFKGVSGERTITDAYFETSLPLVDGQGLIKNFTLELSARYSHYSDFGDTTNPKIGLMLRPTNELLFRSTWSRGFRAPSLNELNKTSSESLSNLVDPCSIVSNVGVFPVCQQLTDSNRNQYLTEFEGNQDLEPEKSTNSTIGTVWSPRALSGFTLSMDVFRIKQNNVVDANAQDIVDFNAQTGEFSDLVIRNSDGEIQKVIAKNFNVGKREVRGLDISSRYQFTSKKGSRYALAFNAAHIHSYTIQANALSSTQDIAGTFVDDATDGLGAIPKWKANIGVMWKSLPWQATYTIHSVSSLEETIPEAETKRRINSWTTHDLQLGYTFGIGKGLRILAGIDNISDTPPPRVASGFNDNLDTRTHELKGRFYYLKLSQRF